MENHEHLGSRQGQRKEGVQNVSTMCELSIGCDGWMLLMMILGPVRSLPGEYPQVNDAGAASFK